MRPLKYLFYWNIYIYLEYDSFPDDFGQFRRFFPYANRWTDRYTDGQTDPHIEMRGSI